MKYEISKCIHSGKQAFVWKDGLFETIYCLCGLKITVHSDWPRVGPFNKYVVMPVHYGLNK